MLQGQPRKVLQGCLHGSACSVTRCTLSGGPASSPCLCSGQWVELTKSKAIANKVCAAPALLRPPPGLPLWLHWPPSAPPPFLLPLPTARSWSTSFSLATPTASTRPRTVRAACSYGNGCSTRPPACLALLCSPATHPGPAQPPAGALHQRAIKELLKTEHCDHAVKVYVRSVLSKRYQNLPRYADPHKLMWKLWHYPMGPANGDIEVRAAGRRTGTHGLMHPPALCQCIRFSLHRIIALRHRMPCVSHLPTAPAPAPTDPAGHTHHAIRGSDCRRPGAARR